MRTSKDLVLGPEISKGVFLDLRLLAERIRGSGMGSTELIFFPDEPISEPTETTRGKGALEWAFHHADPFIWDCTYGEFLKVVKNCDYRAYPDDKFAFNNPLAHEAWAALRNSAAKK